MARLCSLLIRSSHISRPRILCRARQSRGRECEAVIPQDLLREAGCPVPEEQLPVLELQQLQQQELFRWAQLPLPQFVQKLGFVYAGCFVVLGVPVSAAAFDFSTEPVQFLSAASIGAGLAVVAALSRLYLGWSFVGDRLLSATVEYEETGWYDGAVWAKGPQVLMRDRMLSTYTVRPVVARLRASLAAAGAAAALSALLLVAAPSAPPPLVPDTAESAPRSPPRQPTPEQYWENVRKYEPWALDDADLSTASSSRSILDHMATSFE